MVVVVSIIFSCWTGAGLKAQHKRHFWQITSIIFAILATAKFVLYLLTPASGIEAQLTPVSQSLTTKPIVSPLRPVGPHNLPVYRNAKIPPHFINDCRRFDFYTNDKPDRNNYDILLSLQGFAAHPNANALVVDADVSSPTLTISDHAGKISYELSGQSSTAHNFHLPWVNASEDPPSQEAVYYLQTPWIKSYHSLQQLSLLTKIWNLSVIIFAVNQWLAVALFNGRSSKFKYPWMLILLPLVSLLFALMVPIKRTVSYLEIIGCVGAGISFLALLAYNWQPIKGNCYRLFHALLVLTWFIILTRFYADRYPEGFAVLAGGSDSLFHYTFASEILKGDLLHRADAPFSRQFFIRYAMAFVMVFIGEGSAYLLALNGLLFAVAALLLATVTRYMRFAYWWFVPVLWLILGAISPFRTWIPTLFPEILSIALLLVAIKELLRWNADETKPVSAIIIAAIFFSLAIFTRNNYIVSSPLLFLLIIAGSPRSLKTLRWKPAIQFTLVVTLMVGAIGLRNMILAPEAPPALLLSKEIQELALYQGFNAQMTGIPEIIEKYGHLPLKEQFQTLLRKETGLYLKYVLDRIIVLFGGPATIEPTLIHYPRLNVVQFVLFGGLLLKLLLLKRRILDFPVLLNLSFIVPQLAFVIFVIGYVGDGYRFIIPCYPSVLAILVYRLFMVEHNGTIKDLSGNGG